MYGSMPHSVEVEKEILGGVLVSPASLSVAMGSGIRAEDFYIERHRLFWLAFESLCRSGVSVDPVSLQGELRRQGTWGQSDGYRTMSSVMDKSGLSSEVGHYCSLLLSDSIKRLVITASIDTAEEARELSGMDALTDAMHRLREISERGAGSIGLSSGDGVNSYLSHIRKVQDGEVTDSRIPTGLSILDERLGGGVKPGWQVVVLSSSGHGKTSFAVNNLAISCAKAGRPVLVCSLEMKPESILARMIAAESGIPVCAHEKAGLSSYDMSEMVAAGGVVSQLPIEVVDSHHGTVSKIRSAAEEVRMKYGDLGMVVVDYIQLMKSGSGKRESTTEEDISANSKALKHMAVELDCVSVVLSQPVLSAKRERRRPTIQQAKGSGSIEDDCDLALIPWQPGLVDDKIQRNTAELGMGKFRDGNRHSLSSEEIRWSGRRMRFEGI